jgi:hypothetical protein
MTQRAHLSSLQHQRRAPMVSTRTVTLMMLSIIIIMTTTTTVNAEWPNRVQWQVPGEGSYTWIGNGTGILHYYTYYFL